METVYFTTRSFIRHEDNVIDFEEYKEKLAAQQALLAEPEESEAALPREAGPSAAPERRSAVVRLKDALDLAASAAMLLVAVITAVIIL